MFFAEEWTPSCVMATNNFQGEDKIFITINTKGTNFGIDGLVLQMSKTEKLKIGPPCCENGY